MGGRPMIELLLQRGGNVNAKDRLGQTLLFFAMEKRSCEEYNFKTLMDYFLHYQASQRLVLPACNNSILCFSFFVYFNASSC